MAPTGFELIIIYPPLLHDVEILVVVVVTPANYFIAVISFYFVYYSLAGNYQSLLA